MLINQYSYIILGLFMLVLITGLCGRLINIKYGAYAAGLTLMLLVTCQLVLATNDEEYSSAESFDTAITSGKPVILMLYSNLWVVCLSAKPFVQRLESNLREHFLIIKTEVSSVSGKQLRNRYQGGIVPTFIVFDTHGNEVWRQIGSVPDAQMILSLDIHPHWGIWRSNNTQRKMVQTIDKLKGPAYTRQQPTV